MLWVDAAEIRFKISPHDDLSGIRGGDWDLERRFPLSEALKHVSIRQRYVHGKRWEDTKFFEAYRRRIRIEPIRGEATIQGLLAQYYNRVDGMFESLRKSFRTDCPLPKFLIGRDGDVFIGNQGNHRLAMAQILGIRIAGEVLCRHKCLTAA